MIDREGFRPNVGIILVRDDGRVFWARRIHRDGWQFPQGGLAANEGPHDAMLRELYEETGLNAEHVDVLGRTPGWLRYRLPKRYVRRNSRPVCIGQKQIWYLLRLKVDDTAVDLACNDKPEFDAFRWVNFWYPIRNVVPFKRQVYQRALAYLAPIAERHLEVRIRHRSRRKRTPVAPRNDATSDTR